MEKKKIKNSLVQGPITPEKIANSIAHHQVKTNIGAHDIFLGQVRADEIEGKNVVAINMSKFYDKNKKKMYKNICKYIFENPKQLIILLGEYHQYELPIPDWSKILIKHMSNISIRKYFKQKYLSIAM